MSSLRERIEAIPSMPLPRPYKVVEFGCGSYQPAPRVLESVFLKRNPAWSFVDGLSYLGIDNGHRAEEHGYLGPPDYARDEARKRLAEYQERYARNYPEEDIHFIFGSAQDLTLPPASVDEVLAFNVLSSDIDDVAIREMLLKARTLLVAGGLLVTRETQSPWLYDPSRATAELGRLGFESEVVSTQDPIFDPLTEHYGRTEFDYTIQARPPKADRYFCFAQPIK